MKIFSSYLRTGGLPREEERGGEGRRGEECDKWGCNWTVEVGRLEREGEGGRGREGEGGHRRVEEGAGQ